MKSKTKKKVHLSRGYDCDNCGKHETDLEFKKSRIIFDSEGKDEVLLLVYIQCDACGKIYPACLENEESAKLDEKVGILTAKLREAKAKYNMTEYTKLEEQANELMAKLAVIRKQLIEKYNHREYVMNGVKETVNFADV